MDLKRLKPIVEELTEQVDALLALKGGAGSGDWSGDWGHSGRPGRVGGSGGGGGHHTLPEGHQYHKPKPKPPEPEKPKPSSSPEKPSEQPKPKPAPKRKFEVTHYCRQFYMGKYPKKYEAEVRGQIEKVPKDFEKRFPGIRRIIDEKPANVKKPAIEFKDTESMRAGNSAYSTQIVKKWRSHGVGARRQIRHFLK